MSEYLTEPPRDENGNIPREYVRTRNGWPGQGLLNSRVKGGRQLWRPSDNPIPADVYDEAVREYEDRKGFRGIFRRDEVEKTSDKIIKSLAKDVPPAPVTGGLHDPRLMTDAELVEMARALLEADRYDWRGVHARPEQLEPDNYHTFVLLAGRGFGKTRAAAEIVREWVSTPNKRVAIVALGHRELRDVCLDGVSGLLNVIPKKEIAHVKKGLGDLSITLKNGSIIEGHTSGNPDAVRGRSYDAVWLDEYAAYARSTAQDVLDQLWFCLREAKDPKVVITTTPRKVQHVVDLVEKAKTDPGIVLRYGKTRDNTALSEKALQQLEAAYGGTRLGRQELEGELLLDVEGALWNDGLLDLCRASREVDVPQMAGTVVGFDPSGSEDGDQCGIVVVGWDAQGCVWVLANYTTGGSPAERFGAACMAAYKHKAQAFIYEGNYGGDNNKYGLEQRWKALVEEGKIPAEVGQPQIIVSGLKGGKVERAVPMVATLYEKHAIAVEQDRPPVIWHVPPSPTNGMAKLENELTSWEPHARNSPNAMDALVHAGRYVMRRLGLEVGVARVNRNRRIDRGWQP